MYLFTYLCKPIYIIGVCKSSSSYHENWNAIKIKFMYILRKLTHLMSRTKNLDHYEFLNRSIFYKTKCCRKSYRVITLYKKDIFLAKF